MTTFLREVDGVNRNIDVSASDPLPITAPQALPVRASSEWSVAGAAADNALASAERAAPATGNRHIITSVSAAFSAVVDGKLLEIKDGGAAGTVIYRTYVHSQRDLIFSRGLRCAGIARAELAASGGLAQLGVVSIAGYEEKI